MRLFISHIHEEAPFALVLKTWLESSFSGHCDVFVSSDLDDIPPGAKWFEDMDLALRDSRILLVLCSPSSLCRPWVNFETGCAWMKGSSIIPLCHSGQNVFDLPMPFSRFQALRVEDSDFCGNLITSIAKGLSLGKVPRIDLTSMRQEIDAALNGIEQPQVSSKSSTSSSSDEYTDEQLSMLHMLAKSNLDMLPEDAFARKLRIPLQKTRFFLDGLEDGGLVDALRTMEGPADYRLTKKGRGYAVTRGLV